MARLFLILAGIAVGGLLLMGGGAWYWWDRNKDKWIDSAKATVADGQRTGSRVEEAACVALALERHKSDRKLGITTAVEHGLWLTGCLDASKPQRRFCDGVPPQDNPVAIGVWSAAACARHGHTDPYCHTLFQTVSKYCSSASRAGKIEIGAPRGPAT